MAINLEHLNDKEHNEGMYESGVLTATEFNTLVNAVIENQESMIRSISLNNKTFVPDETGKVTIYITDSGYTLKVNDSVDGNKVALGNDFYMTVNIIYKYINGDEEVSPNIPCTAAFYCNGNEVGTMKVGDGETIKFNFGKFFVEGDNDIYVIVSDTEGTLVKCMAHRVNAIYLSIMVNNFNQTKIKTGESWPLSISVSGSEANVFIQVDKEVVQSTQSAATTKTYDISLGLITGLHTLSIYASAVLDSEIVTEPIVYEYMYVANPDDQITIIGTTLNSTDEKPFSIALYNSLRIEFWVYKSGFNGILPINFYIKDSQYQFSKANRDIELVDGESGLLYWNTSIFDENAIGTKTLLIECDGITYERPILITAPDIKLNEVTDALKIKLTSAGRSNSDTDPKFDDWSYGEYKISFSDNVEFSDVGSGWREVNGAVAFRLTKGRYMTLNYQPFLENPAFGDGENILGNMHGLTISIEFATRNCTKRSASVIRCIDDGIGFECFANSMMFASNNQFITADYKEDTKIRVDLVIEGNKKPYKYEGVDSGEKNESGDVVNNSESGTDYEARMLIYINGVYQQMLLIDEETDFSQKNPQYIDFGSEYCDLDIYCIRVYETDLNMRNITDNYSYDTPIASDKIAIKRRCEVFDSNMDVSYTEIQKALPNLPIMVISMEKLPNTKDRLPLNNTIYTNPLNKSNYDIGNASFSVAQGNAEMGNQGTSSMYYPMPWRNFDWRIGKKAVEKPFIIDTQSYKKYPMYEGMPPIKKFTFKKDYASSEMCNNAICSSIFTDMACAIYSNFPNVITEPMRDAVSLGKPASTYRMGLKAIPMFMFNYWGNKYTPMGMFNFIPNKNEEEYLGFTDTTVKEYTFKKSRAQSWEIRDNKVFWDFYMRPTGEVDETGKHTNDIFDYYEAIYPKDVLVGDGDFGDLLGTTTSDILNAQNETKDLLRLHNWLVSTNQKLANNTALGSPYTDNKGNKYNYDTPEYRRAKFLTEYPDYLVIEQWVLYYIWREQFWMYDSGSKNLQIHTYDGIHWGCHVRDCDTALGIDNEGKLGFPYYLEDFDYKLGTEFLFNCSKSPAEQPIGSSTVLNGQLGAIWINLRDCCSDMIQSMYAALYTNSNVSNFSYNNAITLFENHQNAWSESLYNFGSRQYYGGAPYSRWITSGLGDKKNQRRYWLYYGFRYRMSKYHVAANTTAIKWRTRGVPCPIKIVPYSELYVCLGEGKTEYKDTVRHRCLDTVNGVTINPSTSASFDDAITYVFNGDLITDIDYLYDYGDFGSLDLTHATRLRFLRCGKHDRTTKKINTQLQELNLTTCVSLEHIDLTDCQGFGKANNQGGKYNLSLTNQKLLKEYYGSGATMTGITFPETSSLEKIHIGPNLNTLRLTNIINLKEFEMDGGSNIETLIIYNCGEISKTKSYDIITRIFAGENKLKKVEIRGIDWKTVSSEVLEKLCDLKADIRGKIHMPYTGDMTYELKNKLAAQYGDIDNPNNILYITYIAETITQLILKDKIYYSKPGEYQLTFETYPSIGNNYAIGSAKYELDPNSYATVDKDTGILTVTNIGKENAQGSGPYAVLNITVTLYAVDPNNYNIKFDTTYTLSGKCELHFWNKTLKIGDVIYEDGSYSAARDTELYKSNGRTPIGICYYIDEENPDYKLMFSLKTISFESNYNFWGLCTDNESLPNLELANTELNVYDIKEIPNITTTGFNMLNVDYTWNDLFIKDGDNYKWYEFGNNTAAGSGGYMTTTLPQYGFITGEYVPKGKYYTASIIDTRNKLLSDPNLSDFGLRKPEKNYGGSNINEFNDLHSLLTETYSKFGESRYTHLYYPLVSGCYAYQPIYNSTILDKYKAHNWFVPTAGDILRIGYYLYKYYHDSDHENNFFKEAIDYNVLSSSLFAERLWTCIESSNFDSKPSRIWTYDLDMNNSGKYLQYNGSDLTTSATTYPFSKRFSSYRMLPICQI